jgi:DNA end-binding protein Ku
MAAPRAIQSLTISFGLVSIPVKLYTAASPQQVSFNMLSEKTKSRIKQQLYDPVADAVVDRKDIVKGYEYAKGQYVTFTDEEIKKLEAQKSSSLDIVEFVPLDTIDHVYVEKSYYLGPDKGGNKAYKLLAEAMRKAGRVAVGQVSSRGKEQLIMLRPYKEGLILHEVYYADEVRRFEDIDLGDKVEFRPGEQELAGQLIDQLTHEKFEPDKYKDEFRERVLAAVEQKVAGQEISAAPEEPQAQIIDLFDALKASLGNAKAAGSVKAKGPKKTEPEAETESEAPAKKSRSRKAQTG